MKIPEITYTESTVYVISQLIIFGGREIAQGGGKILPEISLKISLQFCENCVIKISPKPQTNYWIHNTYIRTDILAKEHGSNKQIASKSCALSLVRQLFHFGVIEAFTGIKKKKKENEVR